MWAAFVGEELPCQGVHTNSEDPFVVAVEKGETKLIVGHVSTTKQVDFLPSS